MNPNIELMFSVTLILCGIGIIGIGIAEYFIEKQSRKKQRIIFEKYKAGDPNGKNRT